MGLPGQVSEVVTLHFPEQYDQSSQVLFHKGVQQLGNILGSTARGFKFFAGGWAVEEFENPGTANKSRAYVLLTRWENKEAALDVRNTQAFADNFQLLFGVRDLQKYEVFHISARELEKE